MAVAGTGERCLPVCISWPDVERSVQNDHIQCKSGYVVRNTLNSSVRVILAGLMFPRQDPQNGSFRLIHASVHLIAR